MNNLPRFIALSIIFVAAFVLLMWFLNIVLKIALVVALIAFAYYFFTRATATRRRNRNW